MWVFRVKLFNTLSEIFSDNTVERFLKNYFRFLGEVKYSQKESIDVSLLWELINCLDPDNKFIFENVSIAANFLDASCSITNDQLIFDIYQKPAHSFSYLHYRSCHPQYT